MRTIPLSQNKTAIVDNEYYEIALQFKWYCNTIHEIDYAVRNERITAFKVNKRLLHRDVYEYFNGALPPHKKIQFINNNTLDCRIKNLYLKSNLNDTDDKKATLKKVVK